ncbi:hypothetical protein FACS189450_06450 [Spirochaetia bacterium]|nr:hypothetical protein FACS189450_06450 [Spirochaetia bacterium]
MNEKRNKTNPIASTAWILKLTFTCLLIFSTIISVNAETTLKERLEQHVYTLASDEMRGRKAGTKYAHMAAEYIIDQWEEIGIEPFFGSSYIQPFWNNRFQNLVAIIPGNDPSLKNEYIIIGAHYDHIGTTFGLINNGADDNASGVASLIELGRELKLNQSHLKRSIILIAFDAEEIGLIGSTHFIDRWEEPIENIKLMISIDMVGYYQARDEIRYWGSGTIQNGNELILDSQIVPAGLNVVTENFETSIFTGTDTHPFAVKKIPTLHAFTGIVSPYHTPRDDAHLIDYNGLTLIVKHLGNLVETISQDADLESSGRLAKKHKPRKIFNFGFSVNIGSVVDYYNYIIDKKDEKGTVISFGVGFVPQVNFGIFAIRPELQYDQIWAKYPSETMLINSITIPLSLVLQTPDHWFIGGDIFFGGYYSHLFAGKVGGETNDFENTFNCGDIGLTFGFNSNIKPFKIGFTQRISLTDFTPLANYNTVRMRNKSYFTIMYTF